MSTHLVAFFILVFNVSSIATIFAYGQTCREKTFTMRGVAEYAIKDIYEHINFVRSRIGPFVSVLFSKFGSV